MSKFSCFIPCLVAGLSVIIPASTARAQGIHGVAASEGQISAAGHVHLQRPPTHLRMYLQLTGKGKTLEEALAALKERREAAVAKLEKLGVGKSALVLTPPGVDETVVAQQRQMEMMIAQRLGNRGAKKEAKPVKPPITVTTMLTASWPLAGDSTEKLLLAADALHEKVKAAELAGGKEAAPKLAPEEQEVAEEMAGQMAAQMGGEEQQVKPGEPHFVFVARLAPQDRQSALADAFAKAKTQAAELAKAAGAGLGALTGLSGDSSDGEAGNGMNGVFSRPYSSYSPYGNSEAGFLQQFAQTAGGDEQGNESMATKPDGIGFDFVVNATFAVESAKPQK